MSKSLPRWERLITGTVREFSGGTTSQIGGSANGLRLVQTHTQGALMSGLEALALAPDTAEDTGLGSSTGEVKHGRACVYKKHIGRQSSELALCDL